MSNKLDKDYRPKPEFPSSGNEAHTYTVAWSEEDQAYIASVCQFPSLATHGDTMEEALRELKYVVGAVLDEFKA